VGFCIVYFPAQNFLPPAPLVLGYGVLFRVEDSCIGVCVRGNDAQIFSRAVLQCILYEQRIT
jgi:hypothetical protein